MNIKVDVNVIEYFKNKFTKDFLENAFKNKFDGSKIVEKKEKDGEYHIVRLNNEYFKKNLYTVSGDVQLDVLIEKPFWASSDTINVFENGKFYTRKTEWIQQNTYEEIKDIEEIKVWTELKNTQYSLHFDKNLDLKKIEIPSLNRKGSKQTTVYIHHNKIEFVDYKLVFDFDYKLISDENNVLEETKTQTLYKREKYKNNPKKFKKPELDMEFIFYLKMAGKIEYTTKKEEVYE